MKLDTTDLDILRLLQANGRLTHEQLAREVHLSRPAVHERIRRLEQSGVIKGYETQVDWDAIGLPLTAFIWIRTSLSCLPAGRQITALTTETAVVEECHRVAGEWCLLVKTRTASSLALQELLDRIAGIDGVQHTMTTVVLSTISDAITVTPACPVEPEVPRVPGKRQNGNGCALAGSVSAPERRM